MYWKRTVIHKLIKFFKLLLWPDRSCPWTRTCGGHAARQGRRAGRGATVPSPLPAGAAVGMRAGGLWSRRTSVLPGGPGRMQGLRTQPHLLGRRGAPGFCLLHHTHPSCSGDTRGRGTSGVRTLHARGHSHTLIGIYIHISQIPPRLLSKLISVSLSCIVVPCWFPHP